jgi:hypothetical protein
MVIQLFVVLGAVGRAYLVVIAAHVDYGARPRRDFIRPSDLE